uniref:Uncharacterized protein MANES_12G056300 n=1 Tax=Rhizophora mucronata TaxID=61149 RepID=A0A2P2J7S3_RHIMU
MMSSIAESSSKRPVIVRVKRKSFHSPLDAFWLEINERPVKRLHLDLHKVSLSDSADGKAEELKTRKVLVQHVETVTSSEATIDVVQSFVTNSASAVEGKLKCEERKGMYKNNNQKQEALLSKARQNQEVSAKSARFEQIWRRRKGDKEGLDDKVLYDICHFYDVLRVDERSKEVHEQEVMSLEDQRTLASYLPLLREFVPSAADEIESDLHSYTSKQGFAHLVSVNSLFT